MRHSDLHSSIVRYLGKSLACSKTQSCAYIWADRTAACPFLFISGVYSS